MNTLLLSTCPSQPSGFISCGIVSFLFWLFAHINISLPLLEVRLFSLMFKLSHWSTADNGWDHFSLDPGKAWILIKLPYTSVWNTGHMSGFISVKNFTERQCQCVSDEKMQTSLSFSNQTSHGSQCSKHFCLSTPRCRKALHTSLQADVYSHWCLLKNLSFLL